MSEFGNEMDKNLERLKDLKRLQHKMTTLEINFFKYKTAWKEVEFEVSSDPDEKINTQRQTTKGEKSNK